WRESHSPGSGLPLPLLSWKPPYLAAYHSGVSSSLASDVVRRNFITFGLSQLPSFPVLGSGRAVRSEPSLPPGRSASRWTPSLSDPVTAKPLSIALPAYADRFSMRTSTSFSPTAGLWFVLVDR